MLTVLSSASARPNFVKLAAVHHALKNRKDVKHVIVHTGQHYDPLLSDIFFKQLEIPDPEFNLGIKGATDRETTIQATADAFEPILKQVKPDIVLVYGDVNGAVGAARAAKKLGIKIGHVEAGLRSFDKTMPEELNRVEIDQIADELFITEKSAEVNIKMEGIKGRVHFVGNTMIDTLIRMQPVIDQQSVNVSDAGHSLEKFAVVTLHRPSNVDNARILSGILHFLSDVRDCIPLIILKHPRLEKALSKLPDIEALLGNRVSWGKPVSYLNFVALMSKATFLLTDSGGIQEEATFLGKKCFTLRRNTERPSTVDSGSNVLIDPSKESDRQKVLDFAKNPQPITVKIPEKWDGKAGERIADVLLQ